MPAAHGSYLNFYFYSFFFLVIVGYECNIYIYSNTSLCRGLVRIFLIVRDCIYTFYLFWVYILAGIISIHFIYDEKKCVRHKPVHAYRYRVLLRNPSRHRSNNNIMFYCFVKHSTVTIHGNSRMSTSTYSRMYNVIRAICVLRTLYFSL